MAKEKTAFTLIGLEVDPNSATPLYLQVYEQLRAAILERRLRPGQRLPATRELSDKLGISRSTVLLAFEHLAAEGYADGKTGAGTFVSDRIPETLLQANRIATTESGTSPGDGRLSRRGKAILELPLESRLDLENLHPFRSGVPALRDFPFDLWTRLLSQEIKNLRHNDYGYGDPAGYLPLRQAIAAHLRQSRALRCEAEQVIITTGTQQALDLACRLLLNPGEPAMVEDPGYNGAKEALIAAGAHLVPVPVDDQGLDVDFVRKKRSGARLIYITPSHQYPLGKTMSLPRRLALLDWAREQGVWILEDDYDSEYRYGGRPLSSLQGIDRYGQVLYMGTFSKVLYPALRLGYLVVPHALKRVFTAAKAFSDRQSHVLGQVVLARFMTEGHYGRHLRRMRLLYEERQEALIAAARDQLSGWLKIAPADTGLHVVGYLPEGSSDSEISKKLRRAQLFASSLSSYTLSFSHGPGLVLGYAPYRAEETEAAIARMKKVLSEP